MDADIQELVADKLEQAVEGGLISGDSAVQSLLLTSIAQKLGRIADAHEAQQEAQQEDEPVRYTPFCECGERLPCSCSTSRVEL